LDRATVNDKHRYLSQKNGTLFLNMRWLTGLCGYCADREFMPTWYLEFDVKDYEHAHMIRFHRVEQERDGAFARHHFG
jgi:hypothetical protein